ncbi:unnamed protein product, partial [Hapterophycus canaliculatus]
MEDEGQAKQGISGEGPLRSIASPPFARSVISCIVGPLAHNNDTTAAPGLATYAGPTGATPPAVGAAISEQPLNQHSRMHEQHLQQKNSRDHQQRLEQSSDPFGGAGNSLSAPPRTSETPLFSSDGGPTSVDPLSHLLLRPGGMRMERDPPHTLPAPAASADLATPTRFDFSGKPPTVARTMPPPSTAEPVMSRPPPSMPALPPPPPTYDGENSRQPRLCPCQQQQRASGPSPPVPPSGGALPLPPPHAQHQQHQQRVGIAPSAAAAASHTVPPSPRTQEKSLDALVAEFLSSEAPPPPEPVSETLALGDPQGWLASLGQLARRRAWLKLVEIAGTMLVAHRGGGAPNLTAEQAMDLRLRRVMGMLKLGKAVEAAEAAAEARQEAGQPPLAAVS